jgi:hypothetical protein
VNKALFLLLIISNTELSQANDTLLVRVTIMSRPSNAVCLIDGEHKGVTPVELLLAPGKHTLILSQEKLMTGFDTILVKAGEPLTVNDSLFMPPVVRVSSLPSGASVFLDSGFVGRTPLDSLVVTQGHHRVSLQLEQYQQKDVNFIAIAGFSQRIAGELLPKAGFVSVTVSPPDSRITIDGTYAVTGNITLAKLPIGWHTVEISHVGFDDAHPKRILIQPACYEQIDAGLDRFSPNAVLTSLLVPGLGQIVDGSTLKGSLEIAINTGTIFFLVNALSHRTSRDAQFLSARAAYDNATTESAATTARADLEVASSNLSRARGAVTAGAIVALTAYVVTLADALMFHSRNRTISVESNLQLDVKTFNEFNQKQSIEVGLHLSL